MTAPPPPPRLVTAVIGAGPAGLLFCAVSRILFERRGPGAGDFRVRLFDKRQSYARTHRLRMGPDPYRAIARDLADPRFDALIRFLEEAAKLGVPRAYQWSSTGSVEAHGFRGAPSAVSAASASR